MNAYRDSSTNIIGTKGLNLLIAEMTGMSGETLKVQLDTPEMCNKMVTELYNSLLSR